MLKKVCFALIALLLIQAAFYAQLYAKGNDAIVSGNYSIDYKKSAVVQGISAENYIKEFGITTKVNEKDMEARFPSPKLNVNMANGNTMINFSNPNAEKFRVDIYEVDKGLVASFVNISSNSVEIDRQMFEAGSYIYKLSGKSNLYCGTFKLQ